MIKLVSIELTNKCSKQCFFCYNQSQKDGKALWKVDELISFIQDLKENGVEAISFGGGEPLEYPHVFELLSKTQNTIYRSLTTNGLLLQKKEYLNQIIESPPEKIHISIHFPENKNEVNRVIKQVNDIAALGIKSGINLLVRNDNVFESRLAAEFIKSEGIGQERVVYLPMRMKNPVSADAIKFVANIEKFQSISCLKDCGISERFCSISWDKKVAWCSYTHSKKQLTKLDFISLQSNLKKLKLEYCG
jgi:MoaA/NifB/PqqE/SkfB family radical SAM enzyme